MEHGPCTTSARGSTSTPPHRTARRRRPWSIAVAAVAATAVAVGGGLGAMALAAPAPAPKVDLKILVLDDGQPMVGSIVAQLKQDQIPYDRIDLTSGSRRQITSATLTKKDTVPHSAYQAYVLPSTAPAQLSSDELATLRTTAATYDLRSVSAYNWPSADIGLNAPDYSGAVDGMSAQLTPQALSLGWGYLRGSLTMDDVSPSVIESYGYLATPSATPADGTSFTPILTTPIPGKDTTGVLMGVWQDHGRSELVLTYAQNAYQRHAGVLGTGIVTWLTKGLHVGQHRNYFAVQSDDLFLTDGVWAPDDKCTIGSDCDPVKYPEDAEGNYSRMTPADVTYLAQWQAGTGIKIDQAFNGFGVQDWTSTHGTDTLLTAFKAQSKSFRWINHTWSHQFMGCLQNTTVSPWACQTKNGRTQWFSAADIRKEIDSNTTWAKKQGITTDRTELVPGEHSGLKTLPQQPTDNPNLAASLLLTGVRWIASDASREPDQRSVGVSRTVPRYPMNIFYNAETIAQEVDEYNWIYTTRADGGSGACEDRPDITTCITPLSAATGFQQVIVPNEVRIATGHVLANNPRPHFAHQSNLTADRILYPVLDGIVSGYADTFDTTTTPLVNPTLATSGQLLADQATFASKASTVVATVQGTKVTISAKGLFSAPITMPEGTKLSNKVFGQSYAGTRSAWTTLSALTSTFTLTTAPYGTAGNVKAAVGSLKISSLRGVATPTRVVEVPEAHADLLPDDAIATE